MILWFIEKYFIKQQVCLTRCKTTITQKNVFIRIIEWGCKIIFKLLLDALSSIISIMVKKKKIMKSYNSQNNLGIEYCNYFSNKRTLWCMFFFIKLNEAFDTKSSYNLELIYYFLNITNNIYYCVFI